MASRVVPNMAKVRFSGSGLSCCVHYTTVDLRSKTQIYNKVDVYPLVGCVAVAVSFCVYKGTEHLLVSEEATKDGLHIGRDAIHFRNRPFRYCICRETRTSALTPRAVERCSSTRRRLATHGRSARHGTTCTRTTHFTSCPPGTLSAFHTGSEDHRSRPTPSSLLVKGLARS